MTAVRIKCDNCGEWMDKHCSLHVVPCCPHYVQHKSQPAILLTTSPEDRERMTAACRTAGHYWISTSLGDGSVEMVHDYKAQADAILAALAAKGVEG